MPVRKWIVRSTVGTGFGASVRANTAGGNGGGIYVYQGTTTLQDQDVKVTSNSINSNQATGTWVGTGGPWGKGGGIYNDSGSAAVTLTNDTITDNVASSIGYGGGIYNNSGSPTLKNDTIKNNLPDQCAGTNINC